MAKNILALAAIAAVPFLFVAGAASAAKPGSTDPYQIDAVIGGCEQPFKDLEASLKGMYGENPAPKKQSVIDGLVSKDYGADQKTDQRKYAEALSLLAQIEDKATYLYSLTGKDMQISAAAYDAIIGYVSSAPTLEGPAAGIATACVQGLQ